MFMSEALSNFIFRSFPQASRLEKMSVLGVDVTQVLVAEQRAADVIYRVDGAKDVNMQFQENKFDGKKK